MDSKLMMGAMDLLILDVISRGPTYGYQITQTVLENSAGYFELKEGSLYPALHRLERQDLLEAYWVDTEDGRRRKYYKLTAAGARSLEERRREWQQFTSGVQGVLGANYGLA